MGENVEGGGAFSLFLFFFFFANGQRCKGVEGCQRMRMCSLLVNFKGFQFVFVRF
jgi:hypothetical protein